MMERLRTISIEFRASGCTLALWEEDENYSDLITSNAQHSRTLPAYVAYTDNGVLVGHEAFTQRMSNPENTIYDITSLLGGRFDDALLQQQMKNWPFKVVSKDNKAMIEVTLKGEKKQLFPEAIAATLLTFLKESAEAHTGVEPKNAVISVPAYASHLYRCALRDACAIAGLHLWRLMTDLAAAVVGHYLRAPTKEPRDVLMLKLGRGPFSAGVTTVDDGFFEALAIVDDFRVSGTEIDARLANHFAKHFTAQYAKNITGELHAMRRLRAECERAKIALSTAVEATVAIEVDGTTLTGWITRSEYEALIMDMIALLPQFLDRLLQDARRSIYQIREVMLCGGGSAMPCFQRALTEYFAKSPSSPPRFTRPEPAGSVAALAAMSAIIAMCPSPDRSSRLHEIIITEVAPYSLGMLSGADEMSALIPRNTTIPCRKQQAVATVQDNQLEFRFTLYAGERAVVKDNLRLYEVSVGGLMPTPRGHTTIELCFETDMNGIVCFSARPRDPRAWSLCIQYHNTTLLTVTELEKLRDEETATSARRIAGTAASYARRELHAQVDSIWRLIERDEPPTQLLTHDRDALTAAVTEARAWLIATADIPQSAEVYRAKQRALDKRVRRVPASSFGPPID